MGRKFHWCQADQVEAYDYDSTEDCQGEALKFNYWNEDEVPRYFVLCEFHQSEVRLAARDW